MSKFLKHKAINGWNLFWLIAVPMCTIIVVEMMRHDLSSPADVSEMIGFSVRFAVPIIFVVTGISALQKLFPGPVPAWMLRNRKYIGLCFAVAMAWQGVFIAMMSSIHSDYYYEEIFFFRDELEGSTGYLFLTAMVLTSFRFASRHLNPQQWNLLHTFGLYFLWAYPFSTYWWTLSYYSTQAPHDYVYYWLGFTAFALRTAAWGKTRLSAARKADPDSEAPFVLRITGGAVIAFGLLVAATGREWQDAVTAFLTAPAWSANLELWLPFWPFEPFLSLFIIGLGTMIVTTTRVQAVQADPSPTG